ncbi:MAG: HD domain-containing protein [Oribacterium sp.]|nr:HD domain-containing protein [Oribacterium sp.]
MGKLTVEEVEKLFPQLADVKNRDLAKAACEIWVEAFENSSWEDINDPQFAIRAPGVALIKHTENVTANAVYCAENAMKKYGYKVDMDVLILSAVLHDVCKMEENDMGEGGPGTAVKSPVGKIYQHGFLSGYYTQKYNFPKEITSIVVAHSGQSKVIPRSIEGLILYYADMMDADVHFVTAGTTLCLEVD